MLAAKGLYIILFFVVLPLAVEIAILLLRGAGIRTWLLIPEFSVVRLPVVLGAFALGAASQRFPHALTLAATGSIVAIGTMLVGYNLFGDRPGASTQAPFAGSRGIVALWALAATFAGVVVVQFLTRRDGLGRSLFLVGIAVAMLLQLVWPWDILRRPPELATDASDPVSLQIDPNRISMDTSRQSRASGGTATRSITLPVDLTGGHGSSHEYLAPSSSQVELATPSSTALTGPSIYDPKPRDSRFFAALESLLSPDQIRLIGASGDPGSPDGGYVLAHSFSMSDGDFAKLRRGPGEVRVNVDAGLFELERAGELPLREGARWNGGGDQLEVVELRWTGSILQVKIQASVLSLIFAERDADGRQVADSAVLLLANQNSNCAVVLEPGQSYWRPRTAGWLSPFVRSEKTFEVDLQTQLGQGYTPETADDWHDSSRLIIVRKQQLGRLSVGGVVPIHAGMQ